MTQRSAISPPPAEKGGGSNSSSSSSNSSSGRDKPVIAVDLDEVLGQFVLQLCAFHNDKHGTSLTPESFNSYYFHEVWGGTRAEADAKMVEFFQTPYFLGGIPPLAGAAEVLRKHSRSLTFYLVTSRQDSLQAHTREWIDAHYPGMFAGLRFGNHFSTEGAVRSKPDLCRMIGAEMMIDDNIKYAAECASAGIRTLLFGDYAWNRTDGPLPANVLRVPTWAEVDAELQSIVDTRRGEGSGGSGTGGRSPATITGTPPAGGTAGAEGAAGEAQDGDGDGCRRRQQEEQGSKQEDEEKATQETPVPANAVGGHPRRACSASKSSGTGQTAASALAIADAATVNATASSPLPGDNPVAAAAVSKKDAGVPPTAAAAGSKSDLRTASGGRESQQQQQQQQQPAATMSTQQRASTSAVGRNGEDFVPCAA